MVPLEDALADVHPQPTPGLTGWGRRRIANRHADAHVAAFRAHLAAGRPLPRASDFVAEAVRQKGKPYRITSCRCSDTCPCQDCSGLVCGAYNAVAVPLGFPAICTSSFGLAPMLRLVPERQAIFTPGMLGIENAWGTSNGPSGTNGHVVIFTGLDEDGNPTTDPARLVTIEEMGRRWGCCNGPSIGRGFNAWGALPLDFSIPPPAWKKEPDMIIQPGPGMPTGRRKTITLSDDATFVWLKNGASVSGDERHPADPPGWSRWYPRANGTLVLAAGDRWSGLAMNPQGTGICVERHSDGATFDAMFN